MKKAIDAYFALLRLLLVLCLVGMVGLVFGNVVLRYAFNSGITISEELSRLFFLYTTFLGAVVAMREHLHLGVDSLVKRLPAIGKKGCLVASQVLMLLVCALIVQGSWVQAAINLNVGLPVTGLPSAILYAAGLIFGVSAGLIVLYDLYRTVTGQLREQELVMIRESEDAETVESHVRHVAEAAKDIELPIAPAPARASASASATGPRSA